MFLRNLFAALAVPWLATLVSAKTPNIVFILTDDQDLHMNSLDFQPNVQRELIGKGTFYSQHYCTVAVCCPSRVSLLTGKTAHNTNVTAVGTPYGGYPKFIAEGLNDNWLPVWLSDAGYSTYYTGKLFNQFDTTNYNKPHPKGWTENRFFVDPFTYKYFDPVVQTNQSPPKHYKGSYSTDVLAKQGIELLDLAKAKGKPFYLQIASNAPHVDAGIARPAPRHRNLFPDAKVPRTPNFNPDVPSGEGWIKALPKQSEAEVNYHDHMYRERLRALRAVDDLVGDVVRHLEKIGELDNTYIFYSTDNGYHIGHHRLVPGKACGYEEDVNIPFIVRGPGVEAGKKTNIVTTHTDWTPTVFKLLGIPLRADFDGAPIPVKPDEIAIAEESDRRQEHVNVEYWGVPQSEGPYEYKLHGQTNTYKSVRISGKGYSLYYSVWCGGQHELYNMVSDRGQMNNLYRKLDQKLAGRTVKNVRARLDAVLLVLKSCRGNSCINPWKELHPKGDVHNLKEALHPRFDEFYQKRQVKIKYKRCERGYIVANEGPQWPQDGQVFEGPANTIGGKKKGGKKDKKKDRKKGDKKDKKKGHTKGHKRPDAQKTPPA